VSFARAVDIVIDLRIIQGKFWVNAKY